MLLLLIIVVGFFLVSIANTVIKEAHTNAKHRWEDRVMANYLRAEDALYHRLRLEAIDRAVQETGEEMARIAGEAEGEIVEGTAVEVRR